MSDRTANVRLVTDDDGKGMRLIVDCEFETDPDKRRALETEIGEAALQLLLSVGKEQGAEFAVKEMRWVPEKVDPDALPHSPSQDTQTPGQTEQEG